MGRLIRASRKIVDYIIVDTPPAGVLGDAELLARYADEVLMVVRQNFMYAADINDALDTFRSGGTRVLGVVLNSVKTFENSTSTGRYGYGRYGKYGNYSRYGENQRE